MTQAARQRAVPTHACTSSVARLRPALLLPVWLLSAVVSAGARQDPASTPTRQEEAQGEAPPRTRGVAAQAATEALAAQLPPTAAPSAQDEAIAAPAPVDTTPPPGPAVRGVLFRVTPPRPEALPAEVAQVDPGEAAVAAPSAAPAEQAAVEAPRPSYLLGTIHFGTAQEQGIDYAALEATLGEVETFVNEADLGAAWKPDYDGYRWLPADTPLSAMVGGEAFAKARALLPQVRPQDLDRMKPWSVLALLEARGESGGEATLDARLQRIASAAGKRVLHLESLEEQLRALDCVPAGEHVRVLDERLRASWILRIESARAMAWYRARNLEAWLADIDRMEGLSEEARAIEQRARRCLLEERNARWIGQLQTLFQDGPCLVAVGAVHLVGRDGLLAALRRDGYSIEAMPL